MSGSSTTNIVDSIDGFVRERELPVVWSALRRRTIVGVALAGADAVAAAGALLMVSAIFGGAAGVAQVPLLVAICWMCGLYAGRGQIPFERLRLRTLGLALFCALDFASQGLFSVTGVMRSAALLVVLLAIGYYAELAVAQWLQRLGLWAERALVIGGGQRAEALIEELLARPMLGIRPVAIFTPFVGGAPSLSSGALADVPVVSSLDDLDTPIEVAIAVGPGPLAAFERLCVRSRDIENVLLLADGAHCESLWARTRALGRSIGVEVRSTGKRERTVQIKRAMDLLFVGLTCVPAAVLVCLAGLAVKIVDRGPIFYTQRRIGKDGRPIDVLKVRTMYQDAEQRLQDHFAQNPSARAEWELYFKLKDDPRILPIVGAVTRKSSIDELPQLWNVLVGDMSVVGPRPFPQYHLNGFDEEFRSLRATVLPGLTGLWQVGARSDGGIDTQKAEDLFYIRNQSFWLDLYILLQTPAAVLSGRGAR